MLRKLANLFGKLFNDDNEKKFINHNHEVWKGYKVNSNKKILVELCSLPRCVLTWSYFLNFIAQKEQASILAYGEHEKVSSVALMNIFKSFNTQSYISEDIEKTQCEELYGFAEDAFKRCISKRDFLNFSYCGINIGQDIYETYLIQGNPTVDFQDAKLFDVFFKAILKAYFWDQYFFNNDIAAVVVSHDCYLGNIIRRIANKYNVGVYQVITTWGVKLVAGYTMGSNFKNYHKLYMQMSSECQQEIKTWAKKQLERRLCGEVGVDMSYSKKSSFGKTNSMPVLNQSDKLKVLICTHCFFDNPFCYGRSLLFCDFYEWLCFLGEMANKTDYEWYLKCHPDFRPGTKETLSKILTKYPKIKMIPEETSHHQLIREGIKFVFTVYGTVGCEYPLIGAQVINAGNNPHIAYNFNWHPTSIEEYENLILRLPSLKKDIDIEDIYEFYGVHHQYGSYASKKRLKDDLVLSSERAMAKTLCDRANTSDLYKYFIDEWDLVRHEQILKNMDLLYNRMEEYRDGILVEEWN